MKHSAAFLFSTLIALSVSAQISVIEPINKANSSITTAPYDSTSNYLGENIQQYVGQELFVRPKAESLQQFGYKRFIIDPEKGLYARNNTYKPKDSYSVASEYEALKGRYFKVLDVVHGALKLQDKSNNEIVYFAYSSDTDVDYPFYIVGYFEKLKQKFLGKKYLLKDSWFQGTEMIDIATGQPVLNYAEGVVWEVIDLAAADADLMKDFHLILKNNKGQKIMIDDYAIKDDTGVIDVVKANAYKSKFGAGNWALILNGKVKIGMTKEMCEVAWGKPSDINKTTVSGERSEQWVYDSGSYLYFKNGKLTAIQN